MKLDNFPNNDVIDAYYKCRTYLSNHKNIMVSYSGGADSDIVIDFVIKTLEDKHYKDLLKNKNIRFVFYDTGIEYDATKRHIDEVEKKYGIEIERIKAEIPVPLGCKEYGLPFLSKFASEMIERLQKHNFDFKNDGWKSFEELKEKYPKAVCALAWWCNTYPARAGKVSTFNINAFKYLKDFMIENPPDFKISNKCCKGAKKDPSKEYQKKNKIDLKILGLRKAEGGIRTAAIKSCFREGGKYKVDEYFPIWWFTDDTKEQYKSLCGIKYSDCYEKYGFKRTGCAGCPFSSKFDEELEEIKQHEPKLYIAINNIFGKSYEYTRKYKKYKEEMKDKFRKTKKKTPENVILENQISIFDKQTKNT